MSSPIKVPTSIERKSRRSHRERSDSSISGFFPDPSESRSENSVKTAYSNSDRQELLKMGRKLRQAKRQLFLRSVENPTSPVEQLRGILLKISVDAMEPMDDCNSVNDLSVDSYDE